MFRLDSRPPPRPVPVVVRCLNAAGGTVHGLAWILTAAMTFFAWTTAFDGSDLRWVVLGDVQRDHGTGVVTRVEHVANVSRSHNAIYSYRFRHRRAGGRDATGKSYHTAKAPIRRQGDRVTVEYPRGHPHLARIDGMRYGQRHWSLALLLLLVSLPIVVFATLGLKGGARRLRLLRLGLLALAERPAGQKEFVLTSPAGSRVPVSAELLPPWPVMAGAQQVMALHLPADPSVNAFADDLLGVDFARPVDPRAVQTAAAPLWLTSGRVLAYLVTLGLPLAVIVNVAALLFYVFGVETGMEGIFAAGR